MPGGEGRKVRSSPESPKGTGRAGDAGAGILLQLPVRVWWGKYSLAAVSRATAEQIPSLNPWRAPRGIFLCSQGEGAVLEQGKNVRRKEQQRGAENCCPSWSCRVEIQESGMRREEGVSFCHCVHNKL